LEFHSYEELETTYLAQKLHPMDLKNGVAKALNDQLGPVRAYFEQHPENLVAMKKSIGLQ
jgi:tyrosyl-tRNA synthetase